MIIIERFRAGLFDQVAFVVLNVLVVIAVIDYGSGLIRKRFIGERGHLAPCGPGNRGPKAGAAKGARVPHILITGAGRGIGRALAQAALAAGWRVSGTVRRAGSAPEGVAELQLDVTDRAALAGLGAALGSLDVLVNNAGIIGPDRQAPLDMDFAGFAQVLAVNTLAPLAVAQAVLPAMGAGGRIVTVSSQMAWMGHAKPLWYLVRHAEKRREDGERQPRRSTLTARLSS
jgi:hypothetical protein